MLCLGLTVCGVVRLVSWLPVLWSHRSRGKVTEAQGLRLPVLLFGEVPEKVCCTHKCKRRKDAMGGVDPEEESK